MQTVTPGPSHLEVTPIAHGTWQFGGDWESVHEQTALSAPSSAPFGSDKADEHVAPVQAKVVEALGLDHLGKVA